MLNALKPKEWVFVNKFSNPTPSDIVVISLPLSENDRDSVKTKVFKRIAGMPGDTLSIVNSKVMVNGREIPENDIFLHNFIAKIKFQKDTFLFDEAGIEGKYLIDDSCVYMLTLTRKRYNELAAEKRFFSLASNAEDSALFDESVFPYEPSVTWNGDYFGPLYIPREGDSLQLDTNTIKIYKRIISDLEGNTIEISKNRILINGAESKVYAVKKNYFFVVGDNFDSSIDSRNWGFVPEDKIKAKLLFKR